jgi:hypothetical protein
MLIIFDNFFLKGKLTNKNTTINTDKNINIGNAYIGFIENIEIIIQ